MAIRVFEPPYRPKTTAINTEVKTLSNSFGDGYEQVMPDGINAVRRTLSLSWDVLRPDEAERIDSFFTEMQSGVFSWQAPHEAGSRLWRCNKWSISATRGTYSATAEFKEVFA